MPLVIDRTDDQAIEVGNITVKVLKVSRRSIVVAVVAPVGVPIIRGELVAGDVTWNRGLKGRPGERGQLVLTRRVGESVILGGGLVEIRLNRIERGHAKLVIKAPRAIKIERAETNQNTDGGNVTDEAKGIRI